ncbi:MAG: ABC transporter permease [Gemmatimonadaceae bacterium]
MRQINLAFRTLTRTPFVTTVAVVSLALGIGANAAIFSLFDQMLLRAVPAVEPTQLVNLGSPGPKPGAQSCNQAGECDVVFSYPMFRDLEQGQQVFTGLAAHVSFSTNLSFRKQTLNGEGMLVSGSYFPVLGVQPTLGRLLGPADDETIGGHYVTVLSHRYWESRLGSDPAVLNEQIVVNGKSMTIVGVGPRGFDGTTLGNTPDVFVPISMRTVVTPSFEGFENRRSYWAYLFGRLKPGVTMDQAKTALNLIYKRIITDVEAPLQEGMSEQTMVRFKAKALTLEDGRRGQSSMHREAKTPIFMLFAVTGIVLLIACANIANLLLARGASRSTEMAVRLSLGAQRRQVIAQLLLESALLALLAGAVSLLVARWTLALMASLLPADAGQVLQFQIRWPVVLFAGVLSLGTGLLFGLFPALHSTRPDLITAIRANSGQPSGARTAARFRTSLVMVQIALAMALLTSAGLFIKSLDNVSRVDLGVTIDNVVTFAVSPVLNGYEPARSMVLFGRIEEALAAIPGVTSVTASRVPLLAGDNWGNSVSVEGFASGPDVDTGSRFNLVAPKYFSTFGVPLRAGREFTEADAKGAPRVAIVNETFARKFGLGRDAVGKHMSDGGGMQTKLDIEIVGLVQDATYSQVKDAIPPVYYMPYRQIEAGGLVFYVRAAPDASPSVLRAIPRVIAGLDPDLPVEELRTMAQQVRENVFLDRMIGTLSSAFAALATLLAAIGLYGVLAYTVAQRTREIGVRMALGASGTNVRGMVLRQVGLLTLVGGVVGMAGAFGLGRAASSLLYGLQGHDPVVFSLSALGLTLVAFGAGFVPALRASRVDPMQALRYE